MELPWGSCHQPPGCTAAAAMATELSAHSSAMSVSRTGGDGEWWIDWKKGREVVIFFFGCASGGLEFKGGYISVGGDVPKLCVCRRGDNNLCRLSFSTKVSWGQLLLFLRNGVWAREEFGSGSLMLWDGARKLKVASKETKITVTEKS